jgi:Icc-related predicted phosphoesterase
MDFKVTFLSDLHTRHFEWEMRMFERGVLDEIQSSDAIVFCGDMSGRGKKWEVEEFLDWYSKFIPGVKKFFIAGNHDFFFDRQWFPRTERGALRHSREPDFTEVEQLLAKYPDIVYLNDSGFEYMGVKFWGSPISPWFHDWAFNRWEDEISYHWDMIPENVDVLVTHGPPYMILDKLHSKFRGYNKNEHVGCPTLLQKVQEVKPRVHAFGHIHEAYGMHPTIDGVEVETVFVNASNLNQDYQPVNPPITVKIKPKAWKNKE